MCSEVLSTSFAVYKGFSSLVCVLHCVSPVKAETLPLTEECSARGGRLGADLFRLFQHG